jgi:hypothetical protein
MKTRNEGLDMENQTNPKTLTTVQMGKIKRILSSGKKFTENDIKILSGIPIGSYSLPEKPD